jgi:hypothetical protein
MGVFLQQRPAISSKSITRSPKDAVLKHEFEIRTPAERRSPEPAKYLLSIQRRNFLFDFSRLDALSPYHCFIDLSRCALLARFE